MRNTPIKSDRSIFLSFVFLIIYLIFLPSLRPPQKRMLLQTGCRGLSPAGVLGWNPKVLRFLFVFVVLHHHRTNLHGQTEQVDEPVCVLVVVKLACCKGSDGFVIQAVRRCRACRDDIALIQLQLYCACYRFVYLIEISAQCFTQGCVPFTL